MGFTTNLGLVTSKSEPIGALQAISLREQHDAVLTTTKPAFISEVDRATSNNTSSNDSSDRQSSPATSANGPSSSPMKQLPQTPTIATTTARTTITEKETINTAQSSSFAGSSAAFSVAEDGTVTLQTMPEDFARKLASQIHRKLDHFLSNSSYIQSNSQMHTVPRFEYGGIPLGKVIAKGGFSNIIEVNPGTNVTSILDGNGNSSCVNYGQPESQYVVKCLSTKLPLKKLPGATKDIVFEAHTLSSLNHDNIIKLRGLSKDGIDGFKSTRCADGFFMVLDRLGDTLFQRVYQWQAELQYQGRYTGLKKKITVKQIKREQFLEKIGIVVDVSAALAHCHERRIMHRDIKSANVAFNPRDGSAKLIDFGLATELPAYNHAQPNRTYELTGNIGTARYMDPAVILGQEYNEKADVHSFSVLCWECCAGKKPYSSLDAKKVKEHVSKWHERPKVYWSWPRKLKQVMQKGWSRGQEDRPSMAEFHRALVKVQKSLPKSMIDLTACQQ